MRKKKFLLWGAKGHAKVLSEIIHLKGAEVIAVVDRDPNLVSPIKGLQIINGYEGYRNWLRVMKKEIHQFEISAISAIGGSRGVDRVDYLNMFRRDGFETPSLIHPNAYFSEQAFMGSNSHLCASSYVGVDAILGDACIVNTKASVDHESILGHGVHLAPGATLCGCVTIGDFSFIGAGAVILPNLTVGKNSIVGAGSVVTRDIPENVLAYGNPAKVIKEINDA